MACVLVRAYTYIYLHILIYRPVATEFVECSLDKVFCDSSQVNLSPAFIIKNLIQIN